MTPATQVKLLRVLQERKFRRLGGRQRADGGRARDRGHQRQSRPTRSKSGKLREDLFYRLNVFAIELPPLRQRKEDLPLLIQAFLAEFNARNSKPVSALDPAAMRHARAVQLARQRPRAAQRDRARGDPELGRVHRAQAPAAARDRVARTSAKPTLSLTPGTTVEEAENRLILMTLEHTRDNKTRAAEILGISLKTLHNKLNKLRGRVPGRRTIAKKRVSS